MVHNMKSANKVHKGPRPLCPQVSVYLQNWSHVLSYVNKAESTPEIAEVSNTLIPLRSEFSISAHPPVSTQNSRNSHFVANITLA